MEFARPASDQFDIIRFAVGPDPELFQERIDDDGGLGSAGKAVTEGEEQPDPSRQESSFQRNHITFRVAIPFADSSRKT